VKYELDKDSAPFVDRFAHCHDLSGQLRLHPAYRRRTAILDIMVVGPTRGPGVVIRLRPTARCSWKDKGLDEKIRPCRSTISILHSGIVSYRQLPAILTEQIAHFFTHYKDLRRGSGRRSAAGPRPMKPTR
jgi:inorganic pyrophosphatase